MDTKRAEFRVRITITEHKVEMCFPHELHNVTVTYQ